MMHTNESRVMELIGCGYMTIVHGMFIQNLVTHMLKNGRFLFFFFWAEYSFGNPLCLFALLYPSFFHVIPSLWPAPYAGKGELVISMFERLSVMFAVFVSTPVGSSCPLDVSSFLFALSLSV